MKKLIFISLCTFIYSLSFGQAKISADGSLEPTGNFPALKDQHFKGGMRVVSDTTARNLIPSLFRKNGMLVQTLFPYQLWQLDSTNAPIWKPFSSGTNITSLPWDSISGKPANFSTTYALSNDVRDSIQARVRQNYVDSIAGLLLRIADTASMLESYAKASQLFNYLPLSGGTLSGMTTFLDSIVGANQRLTGNIRAASFIRSGGTNTQALLADGSVLNNPINGGVAITFLPVATGTRTLASSIIRQFDGTRLGISLAGDNGFDLVQVGGSGLFMNYINIMGNLGSGSSLRLQPSTTNSSARTWALASSISQFGDFAIRQSNAKDGDPITAGTTFLYFDALGAATFNNSVISTSQGNIINATVDSLITGTSYTLVLTDAGRVKRCTNASGVTVQVPNNTSVAFPLGTLIVFRQRGGTITLSPDSGVTLLSAGNVLTSSGANTHISIMNVGTNIWDVYY